MDLGVKSCFEISIPYKLCRYIILILCSTWQRPCRPKHVVENNTINCCALTGLTVTLIEYRIGKHVEVAAANFKATTPPRLEKLRNIAKNLTKCYPGRDSTPRLHRYVLCQGWMGLGPSYGKGPHPLLCVGSLATRGGGGKTKFAFSSS